MFNLFKSKQTVVTEQKQYGSYPAVVEEIHREFNIAGDRLLKEAKEIIAMMHIGNEGKVNMLKSHGFRNTKEVTQTEKQLTERGSKEKLANALEQLSTMYPKYKFITHDMALAICEKYDLVLGDVGQYTGFVPEKNIKQIAEFFTVENELTTRYGRNYYFGMGRNSFHEYSKEQFDQIKDAEERNRQCVYVVTSGLTDRMRYNSMSQAPHEGPLTKENRELKIAAPLKDMNQEGYKLKNRVLVKDVPDPVVLCPIKRNGIDLYCIVTAWGDEASDPIVINQQMN